MVKVEKLSRKISVGGKKVAVDLNNPIYRFKKNPILTPAQVNKVWKNPALQVKTVHNAGIVEFKGKTLMLFRSHLKSGVSILGIAESKNGVTDWNVRKKPAMIPEEDYELGGIEDPRITQIGKDYYVTYSGYSAKIKNRVKVCLAKTKDFETFEKFGPMVGNNSRNVIIFPEKIKNKYYALFRLNEPKAEFGKNYRRIFLGTCSDLEKNEWVLSKKPIIQSPGGPGAMSDKVGPGAPPIKTRKGWLNIFHGARSTMAGTSYVLGIALHDLKNPRKVQVADSPILFPSKSDCKVRPTDYVHVPNVVFSCGAVRKDDGTILIYYGGCDTVMNLGVTHEDILIKLCEKY